MPGITLADINEAADKKYGPLVIEDAEGGPIRLLPMVRLPRDKRKKIMALIGSAQPTKPPAKKATAKKAASAAPDAAEESFAIIDKMEEALVLGAETPEQGKRLADYLAGDVAKIEFLLGEWTASSKMGEAQPSPS